MWGTNDDLLTSIGYIFNREGNNNEGDDWMCTTSGEKITKILICISQMIDNRYRKNTTKEMGPCASGPAELGTWSE